PSLGSLWLSPCQGVWLPGGSCSNHRLGPGDLLGAVTQRPKNQVALGVWRSGEEGPAKKRIDVLPDDLALLGDFEESAEGRLADEGVAVREALRVAHAWRKEIPCRSILILPGDLVGRRINLDGPRKRHRVIETVRAVVEDQDVAVVQRSGRMLTRDRWSAELPQDLARLAGDAEAGRGEAVAGEEVTVRQLEDTVPLSPEGPWRLDLCDAILHGIEVLPGTPFPDRLSTRRHLGQVVRVHLADIRVRPSGVLT